MPLRCAFAPPGVPGLAAARPCLPAKILRFVDLSLLLVKKERGQAVSSLPPGGCNLPADQRRTAGVLHSGDQYVLLTPTDTAKPLSNTAAEAWRAFSGAA